MQIFDGGSFSQPNPSLGTSPISQGGKPRSRLRKRDAGLALKK